MGLGWSNCIGLGFMADKGSGLGSPSSKDGVIHHTALALLESGKWCVRKEGREVKEWWRAAFCELWGWIQKGRKRGLLKR